MSSDSKEALAAEKKWIIGDTPIENDPSLKVSVGEWLALGVPTSIAILIFLNHASGGLIVTAINQLIALS